MNNNLPFTLPATYDFQKKMVPASATSPLVAFNNWGVTQALPPINDGTATATASVLNHMSTTILASHYSVQTIYVCEHHKNNFSDPGLSLLIADLQKAWNIN